MKKSKFNPMMFLGALGAGGVAIAPFVFLQYVYYKGPGLVAYHLIDHNSLSLSEQFLFRGLESVMLIFGLIHIVFSIYAISQLPQWYAKKKNHPEEQNPLSRVAGVAPFIGFAMMMNVFIAVIRFFVPAIHNNFQELMLPALIVWSILWLFTMRSEISILKKSFLGKFDSEDVHFSWLLHPISLAMVTVTGTGIAAMAKDPIIASTAAFLTLISGTLGFMLFIFKTTTLFRNIMKNEGLAVGHIPGFLNVIPYMTLLGIAGFRMGHFFEHQLHLDIPWFSKLIVIFIFSFEVGYIALGISLMKEFLKTNTFKKEFHVKQWGMICPPVAFAVFGSFFYKAFVPNIFIASLILISIATSVVLYFFMLRKQLICSGVLKGNVLCHN